LLLFSDGYGGAKGGFSSRQSACIHLLLVLQLLP